MHSVERIKTSCSYKEYNLTSFESVENNQQDASCNRLYYSKVY